MKRPLSRRPLGHLAIVLILIGLFIAAILFSGCTMFSKSPVPTDTEKKFFDITTNYVPHLVVSNFVVMVTNTLAVTQFDTNHVAVTNFFPVTTLQTNTVQVTLTNTTYTLAPNAASKAIGDTAGLLTNLGLPGAGGLTAGIIGGIYAAWARRRNAVMAGDLSTQTAVAGSLVQAVETARELMATTPQGQKAKDAYTKWLMAHQKEAGLFTAVTGLVDTFSDNDAAKEAAHKLQGLITQP
ncbi:MAG TPA: hypothetical protein VF077_12935 [Nitrospiraceae bacterium]